MKVRIAALLVVLMVTTTQCMSQRTITVEAQNQDISNNLDLRAVASAFAASHNLQDFEQRLNDYNSGISNLDLNHDGEVDYLRVIETYENNLHVIVIQDVIDQNTFQDVATIVVGRNQFDRSYVQVIGDPFLFGDNYIIDPVFGYSLPIFSYLWSFDYRPWHSPYYWGYYPNWYRYRHPWSVNDYYAHVRYSINFNFNYNYSNHLRNEYAENLYRRVSRNDYARMHPDMTFSRRNENFRNKNDFNNMQSVPAQRNNPYNEGTRRAAGSTWSPANNTYNRQNVTSGNQSTDRRSLTPDTYTTPSQNNRSWNNNTSPSNNNQQRRSYNYPNSSGQGTNYGGGNQNYVSPTPNANTERPSYRIPAANDPQPVKQIDNRPQRVERQSYKPQQAPRTERPAPQNRNEPAKQQQDRRNDNERR